MSGAGHMPGPWKVSTIDGERVLMVGGGDDGSEIVADVRTGWYRNGRSMDEANARLIAAAPEMLEALKEVVEWAGKETAPLDQMPDAMVALLLAREAITKAEGGAS